MAGKADIVDEIAAKADVTKKQAAEAFEVVIDSITRSLKRGERVQLPGFGSFSVSRRDARLGRNPATGQTIQIPASKSVRFKMGKDLKETLN
ncbi:MAG TPA: HU family DNA-binding protein [Thermoanaerobaculia bacterium]|nr:HU family DNA-binding protein [Thermoanaerobaculia bacterium]